MLGVRGKLFVDDRKGASRPGSLNNKQPTAKGVESLGKLIKRALSAVGVNEVPVMKAETLESPKEEHCALLVKRDGKMEGWIYDSDLSARSFMRKNSELETVRLLKVPAQWYKMI